MCLARYFPFYKNTVDLIYSQHLIKLNIVEHESRNDKIKGTQNKLGASTWIFIYYGVGYAYILTTASLISMGAIEV